MSLHHPEITRHSTNRRQLVEVDWQCLVCDPMWLACPMCKMPSNQNVREDLQRETNPCLAIQKHPWAVMLRCTKCTSGSEPWCVCLPCAASFQPPAGRPITTTSQMANHAKTHQSQKKQPRLRRYTQMLDQLVSSGHYRVRLQDIANAGLLDSSIAAAVMKQPTVLASTELSQNATRQASIESVAQGKESPPPSSARSESASMSPIV